MDLSRSQRVGVALREFGADFVCWYIPCTVVFWWVISWLQTWIETNSENPECQQCRVWLVYGSLFAWTWTLQAIYYMLGSCSWAQKFRITEGQHAKKLAQEYSLPDPKRWAESLSFKDILANSLKNQLIYFSLGMVMSLSPIQSTWFQRAGWHETESKVSLVQVLAELCYLLLFFDLLLGFSHYHLHVTFYKYHKDHHQTKGDSPLSGWYMTTLDLIMELWLPIFVPAFILGTSWQAFWIWLLLVEWDGVHSHAAFDFGYPMPSPKRHWLHHLQVQCNYSNGLFDAFLGTEAQKKELAPEIQFPTLLVRKSNRSQDAIKSVKTMD